MFAGTIHEPRVCVCVSVACCRENSPRCALCPSRAFHPLAAFVPRPSVSVASAGLWLPLCDSSLTLPRISLARVCVVLEQTASTFTVVASLALSVTLTQSLVALANGSLEEFWCRARSVPSARAALERGWVSLVCSDILSPRVEACPRRTRRDVRPAREHSLLPTTSDQTSQPAEFKHITKRRKRN